MIPQFVKKDFLLSKNFFLIIMAMVIGLPLFIASRSPEILGVGSFMLTVIFAELILGQYVAMIELKYPKVNALLCAAPFSRSDIVVAKYIHFLLVFVCCCVVYGLTTLMMPSIPSITPFAILMTLLIHVVIYGIYTPFQFKFGVEKTKYAFMIILFAASFGTPLIYNIVSGMDLTIFSNLPEGMKYLILITLVVMILGISIAMSIKIFSKNEL